MQVDPDQKNLKALKEWAGKLACPACVGELRLEGATVACADCGRTYPIVDGIPVLIAERADNSNANSPS